MKTFFKLLFFKYDVNNIDTYPAGCVSLIIWLGLLMAFTILMINQ